MKLMNKTIIVLSIVLGIISYVVYQRSLFAVPVIRFKPPSSITPVKIQNYSNGPASWVRVDTDFSNSDCNAFCKSKGKMCQVSGCEVHKWCGAYGGMVEIETWDTSLGTVCDRSWDGQCNATIDRYPPSYNFACCCG